MSRIAEPTLEQQPLLKERYFVEWWYLLETDHAVFRRLECSSEREALTLAAKIRRIKGKCAVAGSYLGYPNRIMFDQNRNRAARVIYYRQCSREENVIESPWLKSSMENYR